MTCDGYNFTVKTATSILIDALVMSGPIEEEEDPSVFVISASALESLSPEVELQMKICEDFTITEKVLGSFSRHFQSGEGPSRGFLRGP